MKSPLLPTICLCLLSLPQPSRAESKESIRQAKIVTSVLLSTGMVFLITGSALFGHSDAILRDFYDNAPAQAPTVGDLNHQLFLAHNQNGIEHNAGIATIAIGAVITPIGLFALALTLSAKTQ